MPSELYQIFAFSSSLTSIRYLHPGIKFYSYEERLLSLIPSFRTLRRESQSGLRSGPFGFSVCGESMRMYPRFSSSQSGSVLCTNSCEVIRPDIQSLD